MGLSASHCGRAWSAERVVPASTRARFDGARLAGRPARRRCGRHGDAARSALVALVGGSSLADPRRARLSRRAAAAVPRRRAACSPAFAAVRASSRCVVGLARSTRSGSAGRRRSLFDRGLRARAARSVELAVIVAALVRCSRAPLPAAAARGHRRAGRRSCSTPSLASSAAGNWLADGRRSLLGLVDLWSSAVARRRRPTAGRTAFWLHVGRRRSLIGGGLLWLVDGERRSAGSLIARRRRSRYVASARSTRPLELGRRSARSGSSRRRRYFVDEGGRSSASRPGALRSRRTTAGSSSGRPRSSTRARRRLIVAARAAARGSAIAARAREPASASRTLEFAPMKIGVLAVQGNFREHAAMLRALGADVVEVRLPEQLDGPRRARHPRRRVDGDHAPDAALRARGGDPAASRAPVFGTCAGMILLDRAHLGLVDVEVERNALRPPGRELRGRPRARRRGASRCAASSSARRA